MMQELEGEEIKRGPSHVRQGKKTKYAEIAERLDKE